MNTIFIIYTLLVITTIAILYLAFSYTVLKKKLGIRQWCLILCGAISISIFEGVAYNGMEVNNKLTNNTTISNECVSVLSSLPGDTFLTEKVLYNYLLDIRAPFPEVMTYQAKIESDTFNSPLYRRQSNMFEMKSSYSRPSIGDNNKIYQDYKGDWTKSAIDYVMWILKNRVDQLSQNDYIDYLGRRYAEDPKYTSKIKEM